MREHTVLFLVFRHFDLEEVVECLFWWKFALIVGR
jgi:hypothetical protein